MTRHYTNADLLALRDDPVSERRSVFDTQVGGSHYKDMPIQPTQFIAANKMDFLTGNVIKYVCRHKVKGGLEDLKKARHYLDMLIESEYGAAD